MVWQGNENQDKTDKAEANVKKVQDLLQEHGERRKDFIDSVKE